MNNGFIRYLYVNKSWDCLNQPVFSARIWQIAYGHHVGVQILQGKGQSLEKTLENPTMVDGSTTWPMYVWGTSIPWGMCHLKWSTKKNAQTIAQVERITWSTVGTDLLHLSAQHFWDVFFFKDHEMKMQKDTGDLTHTKHPPINKHRLLNC